MEYGEQMFGVRTWRICLGLVKREKESQRENIRKRVSVLGYCWLL